MSDTTVRCPQCGRELESDEGGCEVCRFPVDPPSPAESTEGGLPQPAFQRFVGWLLLIAGAAGLSFGSWRLLSLLRGRTVGIEDVLIAGEASGTVWTAVLFLMLPGALFAGAGVALLQAVRDAKR